MPLDQNSTVPQQNYTSVDSAPVNDPEVPVGAPPTKPNNGTCLLQSTVDLEPSSQSNDASINPILDKPTTSSGNKGLGLTYYRPSLPFSISTKTVFPAPHVGLERPTVGLKYKCDKRKGKTVVKIRPPTSWN